MFRSILPCFILLTSCATAASSRAPASAAAATADLRAQHQAAYRRATELAAQRDLEGAIRQLDTIAEKTASMADTPLAYWIHNELTWLHWGGGDLRGALDETQRGGRALDRSTLSPDDIASMRLHALWDRAYLLLELRDPNAIAAFADYEALAKVRGDHDGLSVLTAFFAARSGKGQEALAAAKAVDVDKDSDLQDLYVIALAFDAGGDHALAHAVRERICNGDTYLMKPLIVAQMEREGFRCAARQ